MGLLAGLALMALAFGMAGQLARQPAPDLVAMDSAPGFLRLAGGGQTSAGGGTAAVLATIEPGAAGAAGPIAADALCRALWDTAGAPAQGPRDAPLRLAVFSAANCPFCTRLDETLTGLLADRPDLRLVRHEWPIFGGATVDAARASIAAAALDAEAGRAMHARLLRSRFQPTPAYIDAVAAEIGLDPARLAGRMAAPETDAALAAAAGLAAAFGLRGTPGLVVEGAVAEGAISRAQIEALLAAEAARPDRPCR